MKYQNKNIGDQTSSLFSDDLKFNNALINEKTAKRRFLIVGEQVQLVRLSQTKSLIVTPQQFTLLIFQRIT